MKLKDFLKQFENLDPELEVYNYYKHDKEILEKRKEYTPILILVQLKK